MKEAELVVRETSLREECLALRKQLDIEASNRTKQEIIINDLQSQMKCIHEQHSMSTGDLHKTIISLRGDVEGKNAIIEKLNENIIQLEGAAASTHSDNMRLASKIHELEMEMKKLKGEASAVHNDLIQVSQVKMDQLMKWEMLLTGKLQIYDVIHK